MDVYPVSFVRKQHEYADVYSYFFTKEGVEYIAGQYTHLKIGEERDRAMVRELSFASAPHEDGLCFTMHIGSQTPFKTAIDVLEPGENAYLFKIKNDIEVNVDAGRPIVFVAGGVGVTPFRSMLMSLHQQGKSANTTLLQVQRGDFLFNEDFTEAVATYVQSAPEDFKAKLETIVHQTENGQYYVCGSDRFIEAAKLYLSNAGVADAQVSIEYFTKQARV